MPATTPQEAAKLLRTYGGYFADRDWVFTSDTGDLEHIRYRSDYTGYNTWTRRLWRWTKGLFARKDPILGINGWWNLRSIGVHTRVALGKDTNLPDGTLVTLNGGRGGVLTFWMEDGIYIQLVRPAVGLALADFLEAEPDHPHAIKIAAEIARSEEDSAQYRMRANADDPNFDHLTQC